MRRCAARFLRILRGPADDDDPDPGDVWAAAASKVANTFSDVVEAESRRLRESRRVEGDDEEAASPCPPREFLAGDRTANPLSSNCFGDLDAVDQVPPLLL